MKKDIINLVIKSDALCESNYDLLLNKITDLTGNKPRVISDEFPKTDEEIVIGKTNREISKKAYELLSKGDYKTDITVGYLIYSDGDSIAVAYDGELLGKRYAEKLAVEYLTEKIIPLRKTPLDSGIIYSEYFDIIEYQEKLDEAFIEKSWAEIEEQLLAMTDRENAYKIMEALRDYRKNILNPNIVTWLANLYDKETGAFYYSNSARDNLGFLPDIESTAFAVSLIHDSGMLVSSETGKTISLIEALSPEMRAKMIAWVKGLQDKDNGCFYHPQWTREQADSKLTRRGRDVGMATMILNLLGASPTYDAPDGTKGDGVLPDGTKITLKKSAPTGSASSDEEKEESVYVDVSVPEFLESEEAFTKFVLENYEARDSYSFGSLLEAQGSVIKNRDDVLASKGEKISFCKIYLDFLKEKQNPETGDWGKSGETMTNRVNGALKITSTLYKMRLLVPNIEKTFAFCVKYSKVDNPESVCNVFNPFYSTSVMLRNVMEMGSEEAIKKVEECRKGIINDADVYVRQLEESIGLFLRPDGSFGYNVHQSCPWSQGMPVAVPHTYEGDFNASGIGFNSVIGTFCATLGINCVPRLAEADLLKFRYITDNIKPVTKNKDFKFDELRYL